MTGPFPLEMARSNHSYSTRGWIYLYESGSGESDGLANSFLSSEPMGTLRFNPLGGIFCVNHLS